MWVWGSNDPPGQFVPPWQQPRSSVPSGPPGVLTDGGVNSGPVRYRAINFSPSSFSAGVKSMTSSAENPFRPYTGGFTGKGCVGAYHSPGTSPFGTGFSSIGQTGFPVTRSKTNSHACLVGTATTLRARPLTVTS